VEFRLGWPPFALRLVLDLNSDQAGDQHDPSEAMRE